MVYGPIDHFHFFSFYELFDRLPPQLPDDGWCRYSVGAICQDSSCTILELLKLFECCSATNTPNGATETEIRLIRTSVHSLQYA